MSESNEFGKICPEGHGFVSFRPLSEKKKDETL